MYLTGQRKKCISFFLVGILVFVTLAGVALSAPVCVYALSLGGLKGTIASLIISLMLQAGVAPTNTTWLNQINASYGVESSIGTIEDMISNGLLTETAEGLVDTGLSNAIQNAPAYSLIDDIFTTVATDVGVNQASGAVNLANTAINCGTLGTIGAFAGAAAVGVGVGILAKHIGEKIFDFVKYGVPLNYDYIINNAQLGGSFLYANYGSGSSVRTRTWDYNVNNIISCTYINTNNGSYVYAMYSGAESSANRVMKQYNQNNQLTDTVPESYNWNRGGLKISGQNTTKNIDNNFGPHFASEADADNYVNGILNGTVQREPIISPDIIGQDGNLVYDPENDTIPSIGNIIPNGGDMTPVDMDDYQDFVDQANDNTENGDTGTEQGDEFMDFVEPYIIDINDQPNIPENPDDVPTYPDRPVNPDQPNIPPKTDVSDEDIQQSLEGATTIDLRSVFPFCIPWDIYNLILIFDTGEDRQAPHITFTFPFNENWVVDVDLAEFDSVAAILRLLELIVFIMGLMVATRSLIGAKG